jgi:hypothetical protein
MVRAFSAWELRIHHLGRWPRLVWNRTFGAPEGAKNGDRTKRAGRQVRRCVYASACGFQVGTAVAVCLGERVDCPSFFRRPGALGARPESPLFLFESDENQHRRARNNAFLAAPNEEPGFLSALLAMWYIALPPPHHRQGYFANGSRHKRCGSGFFRNCASFSGMIHCNCFR